MKAYPSRPARQRGVALVIVLILLLVMTLLGLASLRGTLLEERMSANMYDRSLAFQAAELALRAGEQVVRATVANGGAIGVDCTLTGTICTETPASLFDSNAAGWFTLAENMAGPVAGQPQYYIEFMGKFPLVPVDDGAQSSASGNQYGSSPPTTDKSIYRITARSQSPGVGGRSIVTLQSTVEVK